MQIRSWRQGVVYAAMIGMLASGCKRGEQPNPAGGPPGPAPRMAQKNGAATAEDAHAFGKKLEAAVQAGDRKKVDRLYRATEIAERSLEGLDLTPAFKKEAMVGLNKSLGTQFADQIIQSAQNEGKFTFLHAGMADGTPRAVIRQLMAGGGVNYQIITVARHPDGELVAEDFYVMLTGEPFSQTLRRLIASFAVENNRGMLAKFTNKERLFTDNINKIQSISTAMRQNRQKDALDLFKQLPEELQNDHTVQIMGINAAVGLDDAEHFRLVESFRKNNPGDAAVDMLSIDYLFLKKKYKEAIACMDRVDKAVGGDPYLSTLRANAMMEDGRLADAKTEVDKCIKADPTLAEGYWTRITISLREKNHADTLAWLKKVVAECTVAVDLDELRRNDVYADFAKTRQFQEFDAWLRTRNK